MTLLLSDQAHVIDQSHPRMCTVTWIPDGLGGHYLTSNRDEAPHRASVRVAHRLSATGEGLHYPVDEGAGGTWICLSDRLRAVCLLNGARRKHRHRPPYRRSRGLVALDAFDHPDFEAFVRQADLRGIEPFTMILAESGRARVLQWNGRKADLETVPDQEPCIWSSSTLYPAPVRARRRALFRRFLREYPQPGLEEILHFHEFADSDPVNGLVMNRDGRVRTVSITGMHLHGSAPCWVHRDLLRGDTAFHRLNGKDSGK